MANQDSQNTFHSTGSKLVSLNGNHLFDIISFDPTGGSYTASVYLNTLTGWQTQPDPSWTPSLAASYAYKLTNDRQLAGKEIIDIDGDGLPDIVTSIADSNTKEVYLSNGPIPDVLTQFQNSLGGKISIHYKSASQYTDASGALLNTNIPYIVQTVDTITQDDGMGHTFATTYRYSGGKFDGASKEFRGFSSVRVTDATGAYTDTFYLQDDILKGKVDHIESRDASGNLFKKSVNTWSSNSPSAGVTFPFLTQEDYFEYQGVSTNNTFKQAETTYQYDSYGNVKEIDRLGDINSTTDDRHDFIEFLYNNTASSYLVSLPKHLYTNDASGNKVSESWNYYDGATDNNTLPTKGDLTQVCRWLNGGTNPCTTSGYDTYGNRTSITDAKNHTSTIAYDPTYQTFPVTETNALNQSVTKTYWGVGTPPITPIAGSFAVPGLLATATDPNNIRADSYWDALGRPFANVIPPDSATSPTTKYAYYDYQNSTTPAGVLVQKRQDVGGGTIDTYSFIDGLGRSIQTKTPNSDGVNQNVIDTAYNNVGLVASVSVPYTSAKSSTYTTPSTTALQTTTQYDAMRRVKKIINTDGTYSSRIYAPWSTTYIDPNGHQKLELRDGFGRLAEVDEYLGADGRSATYPSAAFTLYSQTQYSYDVFGNLTQIFDALGNKLTMSYDTLGRKISMHDPDMGDWSYQYDAVGNLTTQTDDKGQTIAFQYDPLNRLQTKTVSSGGDSTPPTTPSGLAATLANSNGISLTWNASTDNVKVAEYRIERCQAINCTNFVEVGAAKLTSYTDRGLLFGTLYLYRVRAVDTSGNMSGYSPTAGATTAPAPPTTLTAIDAPQDQGGAIQLTWSPSPNATIIQQNIYRGAISGGPYTLITSIQDGFTSSYVDKGLTNGTRYYYVVRAYDGTFESASSNESSAAPADNLPPTLSAIRISAVTATGATISWTTDELSDTQVDFGATTSYGSSTSLNSTPLTSHSATIGPFATSTSSTAYHYRVKSKDASGNLAISQDFTYSVGWVQRYDGSGHSVDSARKVVVDASGNVYVTGASNNSSNSDYVTVKYAPNGAQLWAQSYDGLYTDIPYAIAVDSSGNVYVTGQSNNAAGDSDIATVKYDSTGAQKWVARYNNNNSGFNEIGFALTLDAAGNVYVAGSSRTSVGTDPTVANVDYVTIKYNASDGSQAWLQRYSETSNGVNVAVDVAQSIWVDGAGSVYVSGYSYNHGATNPGYTTVRYDSGGNQLWVAKYTGDVDSAIAFNSPTLAGVSGARKIWVDSSGNVYIAGTSLNGSNKDYIVIKYNSGGAPQKVTIYNGAANSDDVLSDLWVDSSGNVYVTGASNNGSNYDYATLKYDPNGNKIWEARYDSGGSVGDYATALRVDASGYIYVTGYSTTSTSIKDYVTIKYDPTGALLWTGSYNNTAIDEAYALFVDPAGNIFVTGASDGGCQGDGSANLS